MATTLHSLKVGIDFGTTYSGVAWAHTATPDEINLIQKWPAGGNRNSEKVPTEITYTTNGTQKWGFEIPLEAERLVWIKLLLDPSKYGNSIAGGPSLVTKTKKLMPHSKTAVDVVADYLRSLKKHTLETLERNFGKEFLEVTPVDWILTVPAVWSDAAKASTMQAAIAAGLGHKHTIQLISEPDAAAVCTLKDIQPNHLKVNDTFVVVDCGGGTVDLISYQIVSLYPKLEVKECAVGSGGMCGSTYINANFEKFVRSRIGNKFDKMKPKGRLIMLKHFDEFLKRTFCDDEDEEIFSCPIPGVADDPDSGVEDGFFVLTREDMRDIFEPVILEIVELVQNQINAVETRTTGEGRQNEYGDDDDYDDDDDNDDDDEEKEETTEALKISAILLVGGFGASEYLRQRLLSDLRVKGGAPVRIMQPTNAWSAVVRGAVLRGLEGGIVRSRLARRNYGVAYGQRYNPAEHLESEKIKSVWTGEYQVPNISRWYIKKGEEVFERNPVSSSFRRHWKMEWKQDIVFSRELLASDLDVAPRRTNTEDSYMLCELVIDLSSVPRDIFPKRTSPNNGFDYYDIEYDLIMTVQSATLLFEFEFEGKIYGSVTAKYY